MQSQAFTLTFGDAAENHAGMQQIGNIAQNGFDLHDLLLIQQKFRENGCETQIINLHWLLESHLQKQHPAYILIIKNALDTLLNLPNAADLLFQEQDALEKDKYAFMWGRVVKKHARHNLCFSDFQQDPDYPNKKGRVFHFNQTPLLNACRNALYQFAGQKAFNLQAEGNYYYDTSKCGVGFHGDAERKIVIAIRLGQSIPLTYVWFHKNKPVSKILNIDYLQHGDIYIMSQKATGFDWKSSSLYTLRHAAGAKKYTLI